MHDEGQGCLGHTGGGDVEQLRLDVDTLGEDTDTRRCDGNGTGSIADTGEAKGHGGDGVKEDGLWAAIVGKEEWRGDCDVGVQDLGDNVTKVAACELLEALRLHTKHGQHVTALHTETGQNRNMNS